MRASLALILSALLIFAPVLSAQEASRIPAECEKVSCGLAPKAEIEALLQKAHDLGFKNGLEACRVKSGAHT